MSRADAGLDEAAVRAYVDALYVSGRSREAAEYLKRLQAESPAAWWTINLQNAGEKDIFAHLCSLAAEEARAEDSSNSAGERTAARIAALHLWAEVDPRAGVEYFEQALLPRLLDDPDLVPVLGAFCSRTLSAHLELTPDDAHWRLRAAADLIEDQVLDPPAFKHLLRDLAQMMVRFGQDDEAVRRLALTLDDLFDVALRLLIPARRATDVAAIEVALGALTLFASTYEPDSLARQASRAIRFLRRANASLAERRVQSLSDTAAALSRLSTDAVHDVRAAEYALENYITLEDQMQDHIDTPRFDRARVLLSVMVKHRLRQAQAADPALSELCASLEGHLIDGILAQSSARVMAILEEKGLLRAAPPDPARLDGELGKLFAEPAWSELKRFGEVVMVLRAAQAEYNGSPLRHPETVASDFDFTGVVALFIKSVEVYLREVLPVDDRADLGKCRQYLSDHPEEFGLGRDQANRLNERIRRWADKIRNGHFHKDRVKSFRDADVIRNGTVELLRELATTLRPTSRRGGQR